MVSWAHANSQPKRHLDRFSRFCTAHSRASLYFTVGHPFPQNCPFPCGIWIPYNSPTWIPDPSELTTETASRSVEPFLQGSLPWQTDRQTDHATRSVTIGRIYVRITAIRPNNTNNSMFGVNVLSGVYCDGWARNWEPSGSLSMTNTSPTTCWKWTSSIENSATRRYSRSQDTRSLYNGSSK